MAAAAQQTEEARPSFESRIFEPEDIFFSRTDGRGVIQAANAVFQRISVYDWDRLIGAPHKIVRHPDMPRGVFELMWSYLKAGRPFGGYVKNLAQDGSHYWVYAVVCPVGEDFVSVRIKPTGPLLTEVEKIYRALRQEERQQDLTPAQSAQRLIEILGKSGFASYEKFMAHGLSVERQARFELLGRAADYRLGALLEVKAGVAQIEGFAEDIVHIFRQTNQIPYNMRLQAGRLEGADGPISVISTNHRQMTQSLSEAVAKFRDMSRLGADLLIEAEFLSGVSMVQRELSQVFAKEPEIDGLPHGPELSLIQDMRISYARKAFDSVLKVADRLVEFSRVCNDVRRLQAGLEMTRVMCKIERSRINDRVDGLDEIVQQLGKAQIDLGALLEKIDAATLAVQEAAETLLQQRKSAA